MSHFNIDKKNQKKINCDVTDQLLSNVFKQSNEALLITDSDKNIITVNQSLTRYTGYTLEELHGKQAQLLISGETSLENYEKMWRTLQRNGASQGELSIQIKGGSYLTVWASISNIFNEDILTNYIISFSDFSERKAAENSMHQLAHHDSLTGLYNRMSLEGRLEQALLTSRREKKYLAVFYIDMDHFKNINDTHGHDIGDGLLIEIAKRLKNSVRECDIVSRLGGDEFVVVITMMDESILSSPLATYIVHMLGLPYTLSGVSLHSSPSLGISIFPDDAEDYTSLIKHADTAMYYAKDKGRNNYQYFTQEMNSKVSDRKKMTSELRIALQQNQFVLYYQPQLRCSDECLHGLDVHVYWQHPEKGLLPPGDFIEFCEETRLINELGAWVLDKACQQLAIWQAQNLMPLKIAVNLSLQQFSDKYLVTEINNIIIRTNIRANDLELKITETVAMNNSESILNQLKELKKSGTTLAINDFGTGYSSIAYLKSLPIQKLKIDRGFVRDLEKNKSDAKVCAAIVALANELGLDVVAEGVETETQKQFFIDLNCKFMQGYLFSKPLTADEANKFILESIK
ncbi:MAG: EAL domain-containing protein [gamma proteobacterium symbiont of Bathyaustriella thionipta]|nr:EAL domain-containing protein [gamma proteobacterium symbiont of Bathyaustriella thionipta]MCU7950903.1 EAL domain-containing protein [gamma proteobacterium symbiont of Bathyaustriella thionipta]MCU7952647.1 EAL domain-containing protein [gamma proteobacterium symbiont of Bathyaustriella thionipta]MCU7955524.1 EAL domain-containing protein [gamma proteobacterium symbiont of Bathyaustriella thionipta]MCU7968576.1 EAL domain-containing protein [gamma proteobacterium symbiont of Bathyaustriella